MSRTFSYAHLGSLPDIGRPRKEYPDSNNMPWRPKRRHSIPLAHQGRPGSAVDNIHPALDSVGSIRPADIAAVAGRKTLAVAVDHSSPDLAVARRAVGTLVVATGRAAFVVAGSRDLGTVRRRRRDRHRIVIPRGKRRQGRLGGRLAECHIYRLPAS